jgi:hypothetical protein
VLQAAKKMQEENLATKRENKYAKTEILDLLEKLEPLISEELRQGGITAK